MPSSTRSNDWSISIGGTTDVAAVVAGGLNFYLLRNEQNKETFLFFHAIVGLGASLDIAKWVHAVKGAHDMVELYEQAEKLLDFATAKFESVDVGNAFSADDLHHCGCYFQQLGGGVAVAGGQGTLMAAYQGFLSLIKKDEDKRLFDFKLTEKSIAVGLNIVMGYGPLFLSKQVPSAE